MQGFIGCAASDLQNLLSPGSALGIIFPTLQWNILNYGRISNTFRGQEAQLAGASLQYRQSVLRAGQEVEDALVAFVQAKQQVRRSEKSVKASERAVELVVTQYREGAVDFNRVYNTQSSLVNQQDQLATTNGNIATNPIRVYVALAGGWEAFSQGEVISNQIVDSPIEALAIPSPN